MKLATGNEHRKRLTSGARTKTHNKMQKQIFHCTSNKIHTNHGGHLPPSFDLLERKSSSWLTLSKLRNVKMKLEKWQGVPSL
jgi:hypothetical protein